MLSLKRVQQSIRVLIGMILSEATILKGGSMADINGLPISTMSTSFFGKIPVSAVPSFVPSPLTHSVNLLVVAMVSLLLGMLSGCSSTEWSLAVT